MKSIHKILLVTAAAASFTLVNRAGQVVMPPRAWDNQIVIVPGVNNDPNLLLPPANRNAPPKVLDQRQLMATTPGTTSDQDPDLLGQYAAVAGTAKQKDMALENFEIAPLK